MNAYLTYADMFRYISVTFCILLTLCHGILPGRSHYRLRVLVCAFLLYAAGLGYVPLSASLAGLGLGRLRASILGWMLLSLFPVMMVRVCFRACWAGVFFRMILCVAAENFMTAAGEYLFARSLFSGFLTVHPILYTVLIACLYTGMLLTGIFLLRPRVSKDENEFYQDAKKMAAVYLGAYISIYVLFSLTKYCFEMVYPSLSETESLPGARVFLRYYLILNLILMSAAVSFIMISAYQALTLRIEKQVISQLLKERQAQYEFSRENSEMMKQMAHDFKHQLSALEKLPDAERQGRIEEAKRRIGFYDAVVYSGNEALDTILTEKSIYCQNRGIRLSCMVRSVLLERIALVDLYTLLGNALDNSIEASERLADPEKKTISLTIRDQDEMLYLQLENYYEGSLRIEGGLPLTTKQEEALHGYGTKSIQAIVKRYGGSLLMRTEDQIFSLEILIPM